ncbi:MAG: hypothetical protein RIQ52_1304 [Pseudomonadota bacterium]|jgi:cysteine desulfurase
MIYADHNAGAPMLPEVLEAMLPFLRDWHGNPSALHRHGRIAHSALESAREEVAGLAGCRPDQVIFCSGGTEANNLAIAGTLAAWKHPGTIAVSATEHAAVMGPARHMTTSGWTLNMLAVDADGQLTREGLDSVSIDTRLISVMLANNETGVIQNMAPVMVTAARHGCMLHADAVQAFGRIPIHFDGSGLQLMTVSAHKMGGPKGIGALIARHPEQLHPLLLGGGQEKGLRSGTEAVASIIGFGKACVLAGQAMPQTTAHLQTLRQQLEEGLDSIKGCQRFGTGSERLPNTVQCSIEGFDGSTLVMLLDRAGICISSGSSCHSAISAPSPVLTAMGVDPVTARGAIRISLGNGNTAEDISHIILTLKTITGA